MCPVTSPPRDKEPRYKLWAWGGILAPYPNPYIPSDPKTPTEKNPLEKEALFPFKWKQEQRESHNFSITPHMSIQFHHTRCVYR